MVDRYWRKIRDVENGVENSLQVASILLKLKEFDEKLNGIGDNSKISDNETNISSNLSKISDNETNISSNLSKISDNETNICSNLSKINTNTKPISSNLERINNIEEFLTSSENFKKTYSIEKQIFRFNRSKHFCTIFEKEIEYDFTKNSLLFIDNNIYYKYDNLLKDYFRLQHEYNIYDDEDNLIHRYLFNKDTYYDENLTPILIKKMMILLYLLKRL